MPLPGSGSQLCHDNKGINGLEIKHLILLYDVVKNKTHTLKFRRIADAQGSPHVPIDASATQSYLPFSSAYNVNGGSPAALWDYNQIFSHASHPLFSNPNTDFFSMSGDFGTLSEMLDTTNL